MKNVKIFLINKGTKDNKNLIQDMYKQDEKIHSIISPPGAVKSNKLVIKSLRNDRKHKNIKNKITKI